MRRTTNGIRSVLHYANLPYHLLCWTCGKNHPKWARLLIGFGIIFGSVYITAHPAIMEALRSCVHAVGMVPILDTMIEAAENAV